MKAFKKQISDLQDNNEAKTKEYELLKNTYDKLEKECEIYSTKATTKFQEQNEAIAVLKERLNIEMQKVEQYVTGKTDKPERKIKTKTHQAVN